MNGFGIYRPSLWARQMEQADGRVSVPAKECSSCRHTIALRHDRCLCGGRKLSKTIFETV